MPSPKKIKKNDRLTIRIEDMFRFMMEFIGRINKLTNTGVIYNAVNQYAKSLDENWLDYWDDDEGVRFIKIAQKFKSSLTNEEKEIINFIQHYKTYFYYYDYQKDQVMINNKGNEYIDRNKINILWPHIKELVKKWTSPNKEIASSVRKDMDKKLIEAKINTPEYDKKYSKHESVNYINKLFSDEIELTETEDILFKQIISSFWEYFSDDGRLFLIDGAKPEPLNYKKVLLLSNYKDEIIKKWITDYNQSEGVTNFLEDILKEADIKTPKMKSKESEDNNPFTDITEFLKKMEK